MVSACTHDPKMVCGGCSAAKLYAEERRANRTVTTRQIDALLDWAEALRTVHVIARDPDHNSLDRLNAVDRLIETEERLRAAMGIEA